MRIVITSTENSYGYLEDDIGARLWGHFPPEADPLKSLYEQFVADGGEVEVDEVHEPPALPRSFSKRRLFGELTDAEYAIWEQVEAQQTPRRQRMLREAVELNEADEDYPDLYVAMVAAFGQERADEVLAKAELA